MLLARQATDLPPVKEDPLDLELKKTVEPVAKLSVKFISFTFGASTHKPAAARVTSAYGVR
ncbi:MAG: hypothetical protein LBK72_08175, partial [Bifidobacteriaceae bacterium]|nr:hypothetical protein [Bifidobacteriaceae bacterium]